MGDHAEDVGKHAIALLAPGIFEVRHDGEFTVDHMRQTLDYFRQHSGGQAHLLVLSDIGELQGISAEARKVAAREAGTLPVRGIAFFNASFQTRLIIKFTLGAVNLFTKTPARVHFADSRESALAWLSAFKEELSRAENPAGH